MEIRKPEFYLRYLMQSAVKRNCVPIVITESLEKGMTRVVRVGTWLNRKEEFVVKPISVRVRGGKAFIYAIPVNDKYVILVDYVYAPKRETHTITITVATPFFEKVRKKIPIKLVPILAPLLELKVDLKDVSSQLAPQTMTMIVVRIMKEFLNRLGVEGVRKLFERKGWVTPEEVKKELDIFREVIPFVIARSFPTIAREMAKSGRIELVVPVEKAAEIINEFSDLWKEYLRKLEELRSKSA